MEKVRARLSYANVMATIAVFVALGGGAYAAATAKKNSVTSKSVKNGSIQGVDVGKDTLSGANINEGTLSIVLPCPSGTIKAAGMCFDSSERGSSDLSGAMSACAQANRFLPTVAELRTLHVQGGVSVNGEQASDLGSDTSHSALGSDSGLGVSTDTGFARPFRCAVVPG